MNPISPILLLSLLLLASGEDSASPPESPAPGEIRLTIVRDPYSSSDQVTLCRVRATNDGSRTWQGRSLRFEARAIDVSPAVHQRGRFGLELPPRGSLETVVALPGRHERFEVELLPVRSGASARTPRMRGTKRKKAAAAAAPAR